VSLRLRNIRSPAHDTYCYISGARSIVGSARDYGSRGRGFKSLRALLLILFLSLDFMCDISRPPRVFSDPNLYLLLNSKVFLSYLFVSNSIQYDWDVEMSI
jgi:hypothetical protein